MKRGAAGFLVLTVFVAACSGGTTETADPAVHATTKAAPLTTADLIGALAAVDLATGWSAVGKPDTSLVPKTGGRVGICGKGNAASRAIANNVIAYAGTPTYRSLGAKAGLGLYSFETEEDAEGFVALTVSQANCPTGIETEQEEAETWEGGHVN
ncbi:uncharacterized protein METZ01_LOCUS489325, partial [marine metagenome]